VVRNSEIDFRMVEYFDAASNSCNLNAHCKLKSVIGRALEAYLAELDSVTLADITQANFANRTPEGALVSHVALSSIQGARKPKTPKAPPSTPSVSQ
jgi:Rrf2 family nitric oxide-sensitive transcriptional repressor